MNGIIIFPYTSEYISKNNLNNLLDYGFNFFSSFISLDFIESLGYNFQTLYSFLESQLPNNYFIITKFVKMNMFYINNYTFIFLKQNNIIYYLSNYSRMNSFQPINYDNVKIMTSNGQFAIYQKRHDTNLFYKVGKKIKQHTAYGTRASQGGGTSDDIEHYLRELQMINLMQNVNLRMQNLNKFKQRYRSKFNQSRILKAYENSIQTNLIAILQEIKSIPNSELRIKKLNEFEIKYKSRLDKPKYDFINKKYNQIKDQSNQQEIIDLLDKLQAIKFIINLDDKKKRIIEFRKKYETKLKDKKYEKVLKKYNKTVLTFNQQKKSYGGIYDRDQGGVYEDKTHIPFSLKIQNLKQIKKLIQKNKKPPLGGQAYENLISQSRHIDKNLSKIYQDYNDIFEFERLHRDLTIKEMFPKRTPQITLTKYLQEYMPPFTSLMRNNALTVSTSRNSLGNKFFTNYLFPYCDRIIEKWNEQTGKQLPKWQQSL